MAHIPETRFATVGDDRVAYQVMGDGSHDLVVSGGQWNHVDLVWEMPGAARFNRQLAAFSRLIHFDPRGTGLSDPRPPGTHDVQRCWAEDLMAVLDAVGSQKATIMVWLDGGMFAIPFAANHPERVESLILFNTVARYDAASDYPEGHPPKTSQDFLHFTRQYFGTERWSLANFPSLANDQHALRAVARASRAMCSPKVAAENFSIGLELDVRSMLHKICVPTLVLARAECDWATPAQMRYVADRIPGARLVEVPGREVFPYVETPEFIRDCVEEFVTGQRLHGETERSLLTILFTDIVDSTAQAARLGDVKWRSLLDRHDQIVFEQVALFGGTLVERTGDGTLATFESPSRAIECALALHHAVDALNIELRAGVHTAEVERRGDGRIGGINVHWCARVMAQAAAGEILVSHVVQGILMGSRYQFDERGVHELKGVPGRCPLYSVVASSR